MSVEDLNSINMRALPLPEIPQAAGELISELMAEDPDAIVIDRSGRQVLVYPKGSASERPELSPASITSLLSEYTVYMIEGPDIGPSALLASESQDTHIAMFCHPSKKREIQCHIETLTYALPLHETRVISPNFLLLCCGESPSGYRLKGMLWESS